MIIKDSWKKCEELLDSIALHKFEQTKLSKSQSELLNFLVEIGFVNVNNFEITENGQKYYQCKYIQQDDKTAQEILSESVKKHSATQAICQLLWGRDGIKRSNIHKLLQHQKLIDQKFDEVDLASFIMLLNQCSIIAYSKKNNAISILYNPISTEISLPREVFLSPDTPYGNIRNLRLTIRECKDNISWIDKNFGVKGFEPLYDEVEGTKIKKIRILTSLDHNVNSKMKSEFERFKQEMEKRGVVVELRVITEKSIALNIHDRWIISENVCFNLPPVNSIYQNQSGEIIKTSIVPPFDEWWNKGISFLENYSAIIALQQTPKN